MACQSDNGFTVARLLHSCGCLVLPLPSHSLTQLVSGCEEVEVAVDYEYDDGGGGSGIIKMLISLSVFRANQPLASQW